MKSKDKKFLIAGFAICLLIAILAPFIASSNPDGLEKTAEQISTANESTIYQAPFADYSIPLFGEGPLGGVAALALGILIVLALGYIIALILKRRKPPEISD